MKKHLLFLVCLAALMTPAAGMAQPPARNFLTGRMSGAQEVPPVATAAQGTAVFHLDRTGTQLRFALVVTRINNVFAAHIHAGARGVNGPILVTLFSGPAGAGRVNGVLSRDTIIRGVTLSNADFDALIAVMRSGNTYVNVHTNPGVPSGEIRGQIIPRP